MKGKNNEGFSGGFTRARSSVTLQKDSFTDVNVHIMKHRFEVVLGWIQEENMSVI